jgi:hypothetical protein
VLIQYDCISIFCLSSRAAALIGWDAALPYLPLNTGFLFSMKARRPSA